MLLATRFFDVVKFTNLTLFSLLLSYKLSFPVVGLKIFSVPNFALKSHKIIFMCHLEKWQNVYSNCLQNLFSGSSLSLSVAACAFRTTTF